MPKNTIDIPLKREKITKNEEVFEAEDYSIDRMEDWG